MSEQQKMIPKFPISQATSAAGGADNSRIETEKEGPSMTYSKARTKSLRVQGSCWGIRDFIKNNTGNLFY